MSKNEVEPFDEFNPVALYLVHLLYRPIVSSLAVLYILRNVKMHIYSLTNWVILIIFKAIVVIFLSLPIPQLLDLCILDVNALDFQYGLLAAAALCHFTPAEVVQKVSGKDTSYICGGSGNASWSYR